MTSGARISMVVVAVAMAAQLGCDSGGGGLPLVGDVRGPTDTSAGSDIRVNRDLPPPPSDAAVDASTPDDPDVTAPRVDVPGTPVDTTAPRVDVATTCQQLANGGEEALYDPSPDAPALIYTLYTDEAEPYDFFSIEIYGGDFGGPMASGTYEIEDMNYLDCGLCVVGGQACQGGDCPQFFLAYSGTVTFTDFPPAIGETFGGSVANVRFREVTFAEDFTSTPVPNGESWCVEGYSFSLPTAAFPEE